MAADLQERNPLITKQLQVQMMGNQYQPVLVEVLSRGSPTRSNTLASGPACRRTSARRGSGLTVFVLYVKL